MFYAEFTKVAVGEVPSQVFSYFAQRGHGVHKNIDMRYVLVAKAVVGYRGAFRLIGFGGTVSGDH